MALRLTSNAKSKLSIQQPIQNIPNDLTIAGDLTVNGVIEVNSATDSALKIGAASNNLSYNVVSLNGDLNDANAMGLEGGASGSDTLYLISPHYISLYPGGEQHAIIGDGRSTFGSGAADTGISIIADGTRLNIFDGTSGGPYQGGANPTALIYRNESNALGLNGYSAALNVGVTGSAITSGYQSTAIIANAAKAANCTGDVVSMIGNGYHFGVSGTAFGAFFSAVNRSSGNSIAIETTTGNGSGTNYPYSPTVGSTPLACGIDIDYNGVVNGSVSALGGPAIQIRAGSNQWDVGIGFMNGSPIKTADIQSDTNAVHILYAHAGSHTNGVNLAAATFSGSAFSSPGYAVNGTGDITGVSVLTSTVTVANLPAASSGNKGMRMMVSNATSTTFWSIVAGSGANIVPVTSDGTNWRIG